MKKGNNIIGAGLITAIASSLCCITPLLALLSGTSGIASTFYWLEPLRPYLIGFTILVLGFAWYQKLKRTKDTDIDCDCETDVKTSFLQSKSFLGIVTIFAIVMTAFPYYSSVFYPNSEKTIVVLDNANLQTVNIDVKGMTCAGCEKHINHAVSQLEGVVKIESSYKKGNAQIEFDNSKTTVEDIKNAVNETGYSVMPTNVN